MTVSRFPPGARALALLMIAALGGCRSDDTHALTPQRTLTRVSVSVPTTSLELGQTVAARAVGFDQDGNPMRVDAVVWTAVDPSIAAVDPRGTVFALTPGATVITANVGGTAGHQSMTVAPSPGIRINEVFPHSPTTPGWVELYNPTSAPVDLSGWILTDSNIFEERRLPAKASISPGGYLVLDETELPITLDSTDAAHLFSRFGVHVDGATWTIDVSPTVGRCPDQPDGFAPLATPTKGAANACRSGAQSAGGTTFATIDRSESR